ncbi:ABC transporter [Putridiphycobacter roseus]|uniref:ABC transporter n=1 Tax=Putridiphycobacter roseus TaxID=2219161 RepID=A0A2W1NRC8_9FLAO|nr:ATP-binding cassette domain-containing protein [Putridiphycobacter roseus]PZE18172.1 ABC transporter [Putridiphycobacter roseus]
MSERILKALMQLFSIIARVDEDIDVEDPSTEGVGREIVEAFLEQELNARDVKEFLSLFDAYLISYQGRKKRKDGKAKRTSVHSVKVLRICTDINKELAQNQKIIVLIRILEFINANDSITQQELDFAETVAKTFNISDEEYLKVKGFVEAPISERIDGKDLLYITANEKENFKAAKHIYAKKLEGEIRVLNVKSVNFYFFKYLGDGTLDLNGQNIVPGRHAILSSGSSIRSSRVKPIYYSDIISRFLSEEGSAKVVFKTEGIEYRFKNQELGLHEFNFSEESGKLLGIMGGSGAGKSTLLNVLNGNYAPSKGKVTINGIDIHHEKEDIEGVIGYVSQDDLLIEELTVFENLFYNAKLCFGNLNDQQIAKRVLKLLTALGLYESKDLKVGSPLEKTISGGQRKRLNISLELIREPSVLFVDEPTSGLSSRDSENIMDLLNELALKGKLIFVVIHQPSSDIFKMFDKLLILDQGGYPIYNGNPVDAIIYFKTLIHHVNCNESECVVCGNVNPEQIFNIIESKVVDEYGMQTPNRKIAPIQWNKHYIESLEPKVEPADKEIELPERIFKIPGFFKQFKTYFIRDIKAKLTNKQYMFINMLEAPILALFLAFFLKMYAVKDDSVSYIFRENQNIPSFLFISVIVALFIGLSVSAEEIIKDQKILKRESFLNLSKGSYLWSKVCIMFIISAIQTISFVLIGNWVLGIQGMWLTYWLVLFSLSCFANLLGLNISATFNSVKVIYILIPLIIIPQLLFSGVIVKFDKINPMFNREDSVPFIGNVMASRWAYEALAVAQFKDNEYNRHIYKYEKAKRSATWKKDYWLKELGTKLNYIKNNFDKKENQAQVFSDIILIKNEIEKELKYYTVLSKNRIYSCDACLVELKNMQFSPNTYQVINNYFEKELKPKYKKIVEDNRKLVDRVKTALVKRDGKENFLKRLNDYHNESLEQFVTNKIDLDKIVEKDGHFIQKSDPIYKDPIDKTFFRAQFYAPSKKLFGVMIDTFWANLLVIWGMVVFLYITLYFDIFKKMLKMFENLLTNVFYKK